MTFVAIKIGGDALLRPTGLRAAASWLLLAAVIALSGCHGLGWLSAQRQMPGAPPFQGSVVGVGYRLTYKAQI